MVVLTEVGHTVASAVAILTLLVVATAPTASARRVVVTCHDGVLDHPTCRECRESSTACDTDQECNGVCVFLVSGFCEFTCVNETVVVPVGEKRLLTVPPTAAIVPRTGSKPRRRLILRCRRHPANAACPGTTTTTALVSTTTTSTSTTETLTTSTTMTTLQGIPCSGGSGPPQCDGACPEGMRCAPNDELPQAAECDCFPTSVTPCGSSGFPACNGACVGDRVCGKFQALDPDSFKIITACGCIDPGATCAFDGSGTCRPGYCGRDLACSYAPLVPRLGRECICAPPVAW